MAFPTALAAVPMGAAISAAAPMPHSTVTMGVTRMSIFVSRLTALPSSEAMMATKKTARGPPAPPIALVANPTGIREKSTSGGQFSARPMATAMPGPTMAEHSPPMVYPTAPSPLPSVTMMSVRNPMCSWVPSVLRMVPTSRVQNNPCAMALMASIKYRLPEKTMSFRLRNARSFSITNLDKK